MRAPAFWFQPSSPISLMLSPLGWLYDQLSKFLRNPIRATRLSIPVLCVGNVTMGGAGKTPVAMEIATRLRAMDLDVHILSRGYGGSERGPLRVDPAFHTAAEVGDEALLLARVAPVWICRDKLVGARAAEAAGAKALILDDGLQNPRIHKDFSVLVMDAQQGAGNGRIFPAGPLREAPADALKRIDAVIFIGTSAGPPLAIIRTAKPFLRAAMQTLLPDKVDKAVYAFCGIGLPDKFYQGLKAAGAEIKGTHSFPDHHPYARAEIESILEEARAMNAVPVTTEKDAVRVPQDLLGQIGVCGLKLVWRDANEFEKVIRKMHAALR